ncbi:ribosome biogenesis/translation initiation ATPase RLI [[Eubacterium] cellulosolvens]
MGVLEKERCKPDDCGIPCYRFCPEVLNRRYAIKFVEGEKKPIIVEDVCTGCGICIKKCPFDAISIVNLPAELERDCSHRYGVNAFKLYRLPVAQEGTVTGLVGRNGTGKTTALKILSGEIVPNLGELEGPPDWHNIVRNYRGSILQDYLNRLSEKRLRIVHKPQYVDRIPGYLKGKVSDVLGRLGDGGRLKMLVELLQLEKIKTRRMSVLSGGELQRLAIAAAAARDSDVYIFDEPSSHLDVSQRLRAARAIRRLVEDDKTVLLAEHDLAMLDYLSDQVCVLYGEPGVYGIVSHVHGVRLGINIYLDGFVPDENMRFRDEPIRFHARPPRDFAPVGSWQLEWPEMRKTFKQFSLTVSAGSAGVGEVVGILGPNGIGKTTFIKLLAGIEELDDGTELAWKGLTVSYKPQYIAAKYQGTVESLFQSVAGSAYGTEAFANQFLASLGLTKLVDRNVQELSGGELQRVAIVTCLAKDSQVYLLDEPSAYLDVEERLAVAKAIRRTVEQKHAFGFVVEHDIVSQDFIADRLMIFDGKPGLEGHAGQPVPLRDGMNSFLSQMDMTFRRDPTSGRPRVNKTGSKLDREQKKIGEYYYAPASD